MPPTNEYRALTIGELQGFAQVDVMNSTGITKALNHFGKQGFVFDGVVHDQDGKECLVFRLDHTSL